MGLVLALLFSRLSRSAEVPSTQDVPLELGARLGIGVPGAVVLKLSGLFALDAFGGGFVVQSFAASHHIGLVKTMAFTHLPSNILLILVPLMPTLSLAILVLLLRFSISQMDVPSRPLLVFARPSLINLPFFIAGTLKIVDDLLLYRAFVRLELRDE